MAAAAARAPATAAQARRVRRELSDLFRNYNQWRAHVTYRGGWQNATQKLQWFWFYFKKYGILGNLACCLHMREAWWESGEKRLVGMDALGHRYWETDEIPRLSEGGMRFLDYPHHFQFADWARIPERWYGWAVMWYGRSPNQWEQIHRELGPEWRDFMMRNPYTNGGGVAEEDHVIVSTFMDGNGTRGSEFSNPFNPDFKHIRRWHGQYEKKQNSMNGWSTRNAYDIDEFDPRDGARDFLEYYKGLSPDQQGQYYASKHLDHTQQPATHDHKERKIDMANNFMRFENKYDGGKWGSQLWWDQRMAMADNTKSSHEYVSAFDDPRYSSANKGQSHEFGYGSRYRAFYQGYNSKARDHVNYNDAAYTSNKSYWREDDQKLGGASHGAEGRIRRHL
eukprot:TRINITY_DN39916_c0_g1_i1.p1 TRINITY_DN39916_c0_g1~~TRINITY_DN39916_c0_g1_i1.p1  ORF type:complete len:413 (+),score=102.81 TRINITY_DN39916_c0_g1_i1:59-1240(+)